MARISLNASTLDTTIGCRSRLGLRIRCVLRFTGFPHSLEIAAGGFIESDGIRDRVRRNVLYVRPYKGAAYCHTHRSSSMPRRGVELKRDPMPHIPSIPHEEQARGPYVLSLQELRRTKWWVGWSRSILSWLSMDSMPFKGVARASCGR